MRKLILLTLSAFMLSGCLATIQSGSLSAVGAGLGSLTGNPVVSATGAAIGTVVAETLDPLGTQEDTVIEQLEAIPEEQRAEVLKNKHIWMTIERLGWWAILIIVGPAIFTWLFLPSLRQMFLMLFKR